MNKTIGAIIILLFLDNFVFRPLAGGCCVLLAAGVTFWLCDKECDI